MSLNGKKSLESGSKGPIFEGLCHYTIQRWTSHDAQSTHKLSEQLFLKKL